MNISPSQSSFANQQAAQLSFAAQSQQYNQIDLNQSAAASRAKRLESLFESLNQVLEEAVVDNFAQQGPGVVDDYMSYVMARLRGADDEAVPEGFESYQDKMEEILDDILLAWETMLTSGDFEGEDVEEFNSIEAVLGVLDRIASRRLSKMLESDFYSRWRFTYRNNFDLAKEGALTQDAPQLEFTQQSKILDFLQAALEAKNEQGQPFLSPEKQEAVKAFLEDFLPPEQHIVI